MRAAAGTGSSGDTACWLALQRAPALGDTGLLNLVEYFGTPRAILEAERAALADVGVAAAVLDYLQAPDWRAVERDLAWAAGERRRIITLQDDRYPRRLRAIADPPPVLFLEGDAALLGRPQLAIVGSRNPTPTGAETAFAFARAFARAGLVITSGLALGIDAAAHRGALAAQGLTIAVAGNGLDRTYPARNHELAQRIAEHGLLVSAFPPGTPPLAANFPRRNRILSGLSLGVLVVEAAQRSGSLITARLASEQGREVFAVPGSIHNPLARGCHALIRSGAKLVETAQDVLEEIAPQLEVELGRGDARETAAVVGDTTVDAAGEFESDPEYRRLLECLGHEPTAVDTLVERTGLTPEAISSMLLILELQGYVAPVPGGLYARTAKRP